MAAPRAGGSPYDGVEPVALAALLAVPRVAAYDSLPSALDAAHTLAAGGAPTGTLVLADRQTAGRGRGGRSWASPGGSGIWLTLVERPTDVTALGVLSLRLGLAAAAALDAFADERVRVKWPNDVYVRGGKVGGILVEVRWREGSPDWAAVGVGVNVRAPADVPGARGLIDGTRRIDVLRSLVPALRRQLAARGPLTAAECAAFTARHLAHGRPALQPAMGVVEGIDSAGALLVRTADGIERCSSGSLVLAPLE